MKFKLADANLRRSAVTGRLALYKKQVCLEMGARNQVRLWLLASIWGASFLFMRILVPVLGPVWTAQSRVTLAGLCLIIWMGLTNSKLEWGRHWRAYLFLGLFGTGLPAVLYSYAALTITSGYLAILNATSPLWGALIGAAVLNEQLTLRKLSGMALGIAGVAFLVRMGPVQFSQEVLIAVLCSLCAAVCYGISGAYSKKKTSALNSIQLATGSQIGAALVLLPLLPLAPIRGDVTLWIFSVALALALFGSAVAYIIYFRLIAEIGPTRALTVTFLIPLFALLWGFVFLDEHISVMMLIGCVGVVAATWLVALPGRVKTISKNPASSI